MNISNEKIIQLIRNMKHICIPKYQRDYVWNEKNCRQLYEDLTQIIKEEIETHFFGTIVHAPNPKTKKADDFIIIDGAQRLTTISCLLIAFKKLVERGELNTSDAEKLIYKIDMTLENDDRKTRLTPSSNIIKEYKSLFDKEDDESINESQITKNFNYFTQQLKNDKEKFTPESFWDAVESLKVIAIALGREDNAQRIFESINSTGVALSEGDKIKNFLMMSIPIEEQDNFYENYWMEIENNTSPYLDVFIQNFLFIKHKSAISSDKTYDPFKIYASKLDKKEVINEMLKYSKYYSWIKKPERVHNPKIQKSIESLRRLNETKTLDAYLLQLIDTYKNGNLTDTDVENCISILENYIFRRKICELQTTNKIFIHLHNAIIKLKGNTENYLERLKHLLLSKEDSDRYPRNDEFLEKLSTRNIFKSRNSISGMWKDYLLEELENFDNKERIDISNLKKNRSCSIEHIMPRKLNEEWIEDLGGEEEAKRVHDLWLHRLGNVTFTAYNSSYSNNSFTIKLNTEHGFKDSKFSLNKFIAECDKWTETEMKKGPNISLKSQRKDGLKSPHPSKNIMNKQTVNPMETIKFIVFI